MKVRWGKNAYGMMGRMKMVAAGHYQLKWQGDVVSIEKQQDVGYHEWYVFVNGAYKFASVKLNDAMDWVNNVWGNEPVMTRNILNPAAGEFPIARKQYGGCCDPGTEKYHCM